MLAAFIFILEENVFVNLVHFRDFLSFLKYSSVLYLVKNMQKIIKVPNSLLQVLMLFILLFSKLYRITVIV